MAINLLKSRHGASARKFYWTCWGLFFVFIAQVGVIQGQDTDRTTLPPIKVMSFNIRYGAANDGENSWSKRTELVLETIRVFDPDLLGAQEVLDFQADFLRDHLPEYGFVGVGRDDGQRKGEFTPIFYRKSRFELTDSGHFWLSETPETPGSKSWDSSLPRIVTWVALVDRSANHQPLGYANTHWDHRGPQARLESAKLMRERADALELELPLIITGDFNSIETLEPYAVLVEGRDSERPPLVDSYRAAHPERSANESSSSRWTGRRQGSRIDWILHSHHFTTLQSVINYTNDRGRYPSDHYPVQAVIRLLAE